ncbi:MAG TPA: hypothetical protein VLY63_18015 [Anaerolineae bacterium]|nr:hypothetical protein [Anaerolineae bacterium]
MATSHNEPEAFTLIRSKLQRPRLPWGPDPPATAAGQAARQFGS